MGWADMMIRLGIGYDSEEGVALGQRVMGFVDEEARRASEKLAEKRGVFPAWAESIWGPDESAAVGPDGDRVRQERELRNCNLLRWPQPERFRFSRAAPAVLSPYLL